MPLSPPSLPPEETYRPSKLKSALMLLLSILLVAGGIFILRNSKTSEDTFMSWLCIVFFGLGIVLSVIQMLPNSSYLRLTPDGLTVCTLWRTVLYRWADIEQFGVAEFSAASRHLGGRQRLVGFNFSSTHPRRDQARTLKNINRQLLGLEGALPDNYGWKVDELAAHLNQWRGKHSDTLTQSGQLTESRRSNRAL